MADDPKIVPDSPPREPIDVKVNPDSPPARPFDVQVSPDGPPITPHDVPTYPDAGPRAPVDVMTYPDGGPVAPFDVQTFPDAPPRAPVQVNTAPDLPPGVPVDVPVALDAPPAPTFQVPTYPDAPPAPPFQVPTSPDAPPGTPVDVAVTPDAPPAAPFQVPITPDPLTAQIKGSPGSPPTVDQIVEALSRFDHTLASFIAGLSSINPITTNVPGGGALDPMALGHWLREYTGTVGAAGIARFITEQSVLYGMNPTVARIFDPSYFLKMLIPGSMGHVTTTVDVEVGKTMQTVAIANDALLKQAVASNEFKPAGNGMGNPGDVYGPENTLADGQELTVDRLVDGAIDGFDPYLRKEQSPTGGTVSRFNASKYFEDRDSFGAQRIRPTVKEDAASGATNAFKSKLAQSNALDGIVRVGVLGEDPDGTVVSYEQNPASIIDDDDARVPLSFTDLRVDPIRNGYRTVYFRPLNLSFSTALAPEYNEGSGFGRVDPTIGYQNTRRTFTVSFEVHAFAPEDLQIMYNKMTWLSSMCYPSYGPDSLFSSGPIVRMRIGDAVATDSGGIPGVIKSLSFDFADAMWELRKGMKVPRSFKVSVEFLALHEGPVGLLDGVFGVFQLPPGGPRPTKDTNLAGGPTDSQEGSRDRATALPGMFAKFGESRRG